MLFRSEIEFGDQAHTRIANYEVQVKFDYEGVLDPDIYTFAHQIQRMSEKVGDLLVQYVITENGKIISNTEGKVSISEGMVWEMDYKADELHMFDISYRFGYNYID